MKKWGPKDTVLVICGVAALVLLLAYLDLYVVPLNAFLRERLQRTPWGLRRGPLGLCFLEEIVCICFGIFNMAGKGEGNRYTMRTVIHLHIVRFLYGTKVSRNHEIFQQGLWRSTTSVRTGLSLILAEVVLDALYFLVPH